MKNFLLKLDEFQQNGCTDYFLFGLTIGTVGCLILIIISHAVINKKGGNEDEQE